MSSPNEIVKERVGFMLDDLTYISQQLSIVDECKDALAIKNHLILISYALRRINSQSSVAVTELCVKSKD